MKYSIVVVILLLLVVGCSPKLTTTSTVSKDSVREVMTYIERVRLDTVTVSVPYEVIRDVSADTARAETSVARARAWVSMGSVVLDLRNKPLSLKQEVKVVDRYITNDVRHSRDDSMTKVVEVAKMNCWQQWHYGVGLSAEILLVCLLCIWVGRWIGRR